MNQQEKEAADDLFYLTKTLMKLCLKKELIKDHTLIYLISGRYKELADIIVKENELEK